MTNWTVPETCAMTGKRRYPTDTAARRELRAIANGPRAAMPGHERRSWYCRSCRGWHLSSKPALFEPSPARHKARKGTEGGDLLGPNIGQKQDPHATAAAASKRAA